MCHDPRVSHTPARIGPYEVVRLLGQGGMSRVYAVRDPRLDRPLALKLLLPSRLSGGTGRDRFWREARALARVRHRGVVRIHEVGELAEGPFILEELVEGTRLDQLVACEPLDARQAARIVRELADAVSAIHAAGLLHRDLKPQNAILRPDGLPVLLDFGLAHEAQGEALTRTGQMMGTPSYMSPEQARGVKGEDLDGRTDVYGLGAVLYELLAGHPPFSGSSLPELLGALMGHGPVWPGSEGRDVPPELAAILRRAMARNPADRHPGAAALRDDLDRFLAGARATPVRPSRRILVGLLVPALALLAVLAAARPRPTLPASAAGAAEARTAARSAPARLWSLAVGERLALTLGHEELDTYGRLRLECRLSVEVRALDPSGLAELVCTFESVRGSAGFEAWGEGPEYDTARGGEQEHLLGCLAASQGRAFTFALDCVSGEVSDVRGLKDVADAVAAQARAEGFADAPAVRLTMSRFFRDRRLERALAVLLQVRGAPWRAAGGAGDERRFRLAQEPEPFALEGIRGNFSPGPRDRCRLSGEASWAGERLRRSRVREELLLPPGRPGRFQLEVWLELTPLR